MLHRYISQFLEYCRLVDFSICSIQALSARLNEFALFLELNKIRSVKRVSYQHLIEFAADYNSPSIHVTKSRVWGLLGRLFRFFNKSDTLLCFYISFFSYSKAVGMQNMFCIITIFILSC
jgi:hypothetical protein